MNFTRRTGIIILIFYAGGSTCFSSGQWTEGENVEISINQKKKNLEKIHDLEISVRYREKGEISHFQVKGESWGPSMIAWFWNARKISEIKPWVFLIIM